eukprot:scaffold14888_cov51-Phaeocystis_antarctica.AAC.3
MRHSIRTSAAACASPDIACATKHASSPSSLSGVPSSAACSAAAARRLSASRTRSASTTPLSGTSSSASPSSRSRKVRSPLPVTSKVWTSTSCGARSLNTEPGDEEEQLRATMSSDIARARARPRGEGARIDGMGTFDTG